MILISIKIFKITHVYKNGGKFCNNEFNIITYNDTSIKNEN